MRYLPHTETEIAEMLATIGVDSIDALFEPVPAGFRRQGPLELEPQLDEASLMAQLKELAAKNTGAELLSFLGAGMYAHHVPPAVDQLLLRSEFYTAYTPYQAEVSQGTLQAMYEYQTLVSELMGMEVANASMYDGASATAEAVLMARRITGRTHCVLSEGLHPDYAAAVRAYVQGVGGDATLQTAPLTANAQTDVGQLASLVDDKTAAVVVGYPNFLGAVEDLQAIQAVCTERGALLVTATTEPYALSVLESPGSLGAAIAVGEGQALACPPQFGGPGVGLFACRKEHVRQIPGRLVGRTQDASGETGYVLTLATREQHIRRERATSNICTNHGLIALAFTIRLAMLGRSGFAQAGKLILSRTEYLKQRIRNLPSFDFVHSTPTFNEFVVRWSGGNADGLVQQLCGQGILPGVALGRFDDERKNELMIAVTERHDRQALDRLVDALGRARPEAEAA